MLVPKKRVQFCFPDVSQLIFIMNLISRWFGRVCLLSSGAPINAVSTSVMRQSWMRVFSDCDRWYTSFVDVGRFDTAQLLSIRSINSTQRLNWVLTSTFRSRVILSSFFFSLVWIFFPLKKWIMRDLNSEDRRFSQFPFGSSSNFRGTSNRNCHPPPDNRSTIACFLLLGPVI